MTAPTALGVLALGVALRASGTRMRRLGLGVTLVIVIGSLASQAVGDAGVADLTPSTPTAGAFALVGVGVATRTSTPRWARASFAAALALAYLVVVAYITGSDDLIFLDLGFATNGMSVPTAVAVSLLAGAGLASTVPAVRSPTDRFFTLAAIVTVGMPLVSAALVSASGVNDATRLTAVLTLPAAALVAFLAIAAGRARGAAPTGAIAEEMLRSLVADLSDAVVVVDEQGRIVDVNDRAVRLFGYPTGEFLGMQLEVLLPDSLRERHVAHRARFARNPQHVNMSDRDDLVAVRADGTVIDVEVGLTPVRGRRGLLVAATVNDVSERRQNMRAERRRREQLEAMLKREHEIVDELRELDETKDLILSAISHELRTPLTAVRGFAEVLERQFHLLTPQLQQQLLRRLHAQAERLDTMLGDLLDLERLRRDRQLGDLKTIRLDHAIVDPIDAARATSGRDVVVEAAAVEAHADVRHVQRIVDNLLSNAVKYAPDGQIWLRVLDTAAGPTIEVEDEGPGLSPPIRPRIFKPFERGHQVDQAKPGIGIGLALVARLVDSMGGTITVDDGPRSGGALFRVVLQPARHTLYESGAQRVGLADA